LQQNGLENGKNYILYTTLDAIKEKYANTTEEERPFILCTRPLSEELPKQQPGLKTLNNLNLEEEIDLTQEIIWRVKAIKQSDTPQFTENKKENTGQNTDLKKEQSVIPDKFIDMKNEETLKSQITKLVRQLKAQKINKVILGCTELPIAFKEYADPEVLEGFEFIDAADILVEIIEQPVSN
jgi:hypothetical protein